MADEKVPPGEAASEAEVAKRYFGSFAGDYHRAFHGAGESFLHRTINRLFRRRTFERRTEDVGTVLSTFGVKGKHVIDIGCGSGEVSMLAARLGARVSGLDIVPDMVRIATEQAARERVQDRCTFRVFDMVGEPLPQGDVSMMVGVVEYYRDIEWLIGKVSAATGELMIIVDTRGPWWRRALRYMLAGVKRFNLYYHPPDQVAAAARRHGFSEDRRIVGHSYTLFAFRRARPA
jgi:SAM-dependent methyltransferase